MQKFLIIQTAFIGDVVLATCLVEKLHRHFPDARIDFMVRQGNESLFNGHPYLHEVLVWDKKNGKLRNWWKLLLQIRRTGYDRVINVQRFASTGLLTAFSGASQTIGFDKNPFSFLFSLKISHQVGGQQGAVHEIDRNLALVSGFTDSTRVMPRLYPTLQDEQWIQSLHLDRYITVAPASVWFTKQYPIEKWISFIGALPAHWQVCLLGGPADKDLCSKIQEACNPRKILNLCGTLSFLQSASLMKSAAMNYVNDSAPLHFASALNAPVTAVYCSTVPAFGFGPLSDRRFIVETKETLDCRPCGLHGYRACPRGHFNCAWQIRDDQLLETLELPNP